MTIKLFDYQKEGVQFLLDHHFAILGDQMGLGKTVQAIEVANQLELETLVVCPAFLQTNWKDEIEKFSKDPKKFHVISYSSLNKFKNKFSDYDLVICDEFHYLKNLRAQRTILFHEFMEKAPPERFIGLTGTAIKNRVGEFYSLLATMDYNKRHTSGERLTEHFPNYWTFCKHFSNEKTQYIKGRKITSFEGIRNIDHLKRLMAGKYLRRRADKVLNLPPITRKTIVVGRGNNNVLAEAWRQLKDEGKLGHFSTAKVQSAKLKVPYTIRYVKDLLDQGECPVLIFTDHIESARRISEGFKTGKLVTGSTPVDTRGNYVKLFQQGKCDVLVATTGSLSVGVTLTKTANVVFNDLPWVPGDLAQAEKRIHRIGQKRHCTVHNIAWGHIDKLIIQTLNEKVDVINKVL